MNFPRRSARLNQQAQTNYPQQGFTSIPTFQSYSQPSSISSSSHPSPTNDHLSLPEQNQQYSQSQFLAPNQDFNPPFPSPSANNINPFFGRNQHYEQEMGGQPQQNGNTSSTAQTNNSNNNGYQNQQTQNTEQQHHHNSFSQPSRANYPPTSTNGVPPGLPPDFLAEAAKRAQMACLMRDLDDVSL